MVLTNLDHQIFLGLNSYAGKSAIFDSIGIFLAVQGIYVMIATAVVFFLSGKYRNNVLLASFSALLSRFLVVELVKVLVDRPRPFEMLPTYQLISDFGSGRSFSSGHAVIMFSIAFSFYRTRIFWPFMIFAMASSLARVFVGVHYPLDILASVPIALAMVWLLNRSMKVIK